MDALLRAVVHEVLGDAEGGVALDVAHEVFLAVAVVEDLEHEVEPAPLVGHDPGHALVVVGLRHIDDGHHVG